MPAFSTDRSPATSLLVWGHAPGTTGDVALDELDDPVVSLATQSGDDPEPDERADLFC
jgi:hypothetical protein